MDTKKFDERFKRYGVTFDRIMDGKIDLSSHPMKFDIEEALKEVIPDETTKNDILTEMKYRAKEMAKKPAKSLSAKEFKELKKREKQAKMISNNLKYLEKTFDGYSFKNGFMPLTGGIPMVDFSQPKLQAYYATSLGKSSKFNTQVNLEVVKAVQEGKSIQSPDKIVSFQGGHIWRMLQSPVWSSAYSEFSVNSQHMIETFMQFQNKIKQNGSFFTFDIETLGSRTHKDLFHVTEIAFSKFSSVNGKMAEQFTGTYLIRPSETTYEYLRRQMNILEANPYLFTKLDKDVQRSMVDLMKYSTIAMEGLTPAQFRQLNNGALEVVHSNVVDLNKLYNKGTVDHRVLIDQFDEFAKHMKSGLENLMKNAITASEAINRFNQIVDRANKRGEFLIGHNSSVFDLPVLQEFANRNNLNIVTPTNHLDWFKLEQAVFHDPFAMQEYFGRKKGMAYQEGPWSLEEHRRTLFSGIDEYEKLKGQAHSAGFDVGKWGLGGVVSETVDKMNTYIEKAKTNEMVSPFERSSKLLYNDEPLKIGERFFAVKALKKGEGSSDFIAEITKDGIRPSTSISSDFILQSESFYTLKDVKEIGENKYALELLNEDTQTISYVIREGEDARARLQQFIHEHLRVADEMILGLQEDIYKANLTDRARRRYEGLFGLVQKSTMGFDGLKRMVENVEVLASEFDGNWEALTPEKRAYFESKMNFNTLPKGAFNKAEAEQFWEMAPRLYSEREVLRTAIDRIEEAIPISSELKPHQQRDLKIQRSLALRETMRQISEMVPEDVAEREALPYERRVFRFNDLLTGEERSLQLRDPASAYESILRFIYEENRNYEDAPELKNVVAKERYESLVRSLYRSGGITQDVLDEHIRLIDESNISPALAARKLADQLTSNLELLEKIEEENKVIKSIALTEREGLKNLAKEKIEEAVERGVRFATEVAGVRVEGQSIELTKALKDQLSKLDTEDPLTKLRPNNEKAIQTILDRIAEIDKDGRIGIAVSADDNKAYVHLFNNEDTEHVLGQFDKGNIDTKKAVRLEIPLINDGVMRHNNMILNAKSYIVPTTNGYEKISSVERLVDYFDETNMRRIINNVKEGEIDLAQWRANQILKEGINDLSGISRHVGNENDTMIFKRNQSDILKQSYIDVTSGLSHDLYKKGILTREHFQDHAFVDDDKSSGKLKKYITGDMLTLEGADILDRNKIDWMKENFGVQTYVNTIKSEHQLGTVSMIDLSEATPFGYFTRQTRDNAPQSKNYAPFTQHMQSVLKRAYKEDGVYVNFDHPIVTDLQEQLERRTETTDKSSVYIKAKYMSDEEIFKRLNEIVNEDGGIDLLLKDNVLIEKEGGSVFGKYEWNPVRLPSTYEQRMAINEKIANTLVIDRMKFYDFDDSYQVAKSLIDENGQIKMNATLRENQIIAQKIVNGEVVDTIRYDGPNGGRIVLSDGRLGVQYREPAHKIFLSYEKGVFESFSQELLERVSGVKGIGLLAHPDVLKHEDYDSILKGRMNRLVDEKLNNPLLSVEEKTKMIEEMKQMDLGLLVEQDESGRYYLRERIKQEGIQTINLKELDSFLTKYGVDNDYYIQPLSIANVSNYAEVAEEGVGKVKYGPRELGVLRQVGLEKTADLIEQRILEKSIQRGVFDEAKGIVTALKSFVNGAPEDAVILSPSDFKDVPEHADQKYLYRNTVLDTEYIESKVGGFGEEGKGFWLKLPEVDGWKLKVDEKEVSEIFLPALDLKGEENQVWKTSIQRMNQQIIEASKRLEEAKYSGEPLPIKQRLIQNAFEDLQKSLNDMAGVLKESVFASKNFVSENVLSGRLDKTMTGIGHVMSPTQSQLLEDEVTYIAREDAEKIKINEDFARQFGLGEKQAVNATLADILDHAEKAGKDFYGLDLRYPTFHKNAIQVSKLRIGEGVKAGDQYITSMIGYLLREDSDGDSNHLAIIDDIEAQKEIAKVYQSRIDENTEQIRRMAGLYEKITGSSREAFYDFLSGKEDVRVYDYSSLGEDGVIHAFDPRNKKVATEEVMSKYAKQLIGHASNLNYRYTTMAREFFDPSTDEGRRAIEAIEEFFEGKQGIEQKIISAKHGIDGVLELNINPSVKLIEALQRRDWATALEYDKVYLGGQFTKNARMEEAIAAIQILEENISNEQFRSKSYRVGLSRLGDVSVEEVVGWLDGSSDNIAQQNYHLNRLIELFGEKQSGVDIDGAKEAAKVNTEPFIHKPPTHLIDDAFEEVAQQTEKQIVKQGVNAHVLSDVFSGRFKVGLGIGAGLGLMAMLSQATTSVDEVVNENRGNMQYGDDEIPLQQPYVARVEENDTLPHGLQVRVTGRSSSVDHDMLGSLASEALYKTGFQGQINIRTTDDRSSLDKQWLQQQFASLINNGYIGG